MNITSKIIVMAFLFTSVTFTQTLDRDVHQEDIQKAISIHKIVLGNDCKVQPFRLDQNNSSEVGQINNHLRSLRIVEQNNQILSIIIEQWQGGTWENLIKYTYTYNTDGNITEMLAEMFTGGVWMSNMKWLYAYDGQGFLTSLLVKMWFGSSWEDLSRTTYTNNVSGDAIQRISESRDILSGIWSNTLKDDITYNANHKPLVITSQEWVGSSWVNNFRETNTYDGNGNLAMSLNEDWVGGYWVNHLTTTYTYNNNILSEFITQEWSGGNWVNYKKNTFTYSNNNLDVVNIMYDWVGSAWVDTDKMTSTTNSELTQTVMIWQKWESDNWVNFQKWTTNFSGATGIEDNFAFTPNDFNLSQNYPNPFNPNTKFNYSITQSVLVTLKVYDVLGTEIETLVSEEKPVGTYGLNWNAVNLPSGVYFYRLQAGDFVQTKKMILLK